MKIINKLLKLIIFFKATQCFSSRDTEKSKLNIVHPSATNTNKDQIAIFEEIGS